MKRSMARVVATLSTAAVLVMNASQPAAAIHDIVGCDTEGLDPLLLVIHRAVVLLSIVGVLVAVAMLVYAGVMTMWGSEDAKRRAIKRVQRVLIGIGIVVTAPYVVAFLIAPFDICLGGV